jgi:hypothetical protein
VLIAIVSLFDIREFLAVCWLTCEQFRADRVIGYRAAARINVIWMHRCYRVHGVSVFPLSRLLRHLVGRI